MRMSDWSSDVCSSDLAHLGTGTTRCLDDLAGRAIDQTVIESLEPNANLLVRHGNFLINRVERATRPGSNAPAPVSKTYLMTLATTPAPTVRPPSRIAKRRPSSDRKSVV